MIEKLKNILIFENKNISVAESLTSGTIQSLISSVNGASGFFQGGITAYNIDIKKKFFTFNYEDAITCDCVSEEIALSMAKGITSIMDSDYGISTTGFAVSNVNVKEAYAYVCIYNKNTDKNKILKIENKDNLSRTCFQMEISKSAILFFLDNIGVLN